MLGHSDFAMTGKVTSEQAEETLKKIAARKARQQLARKERLK